MDSSLGSILNDLGAMRAQLAAPSLRSAMGAPASPDDSFATQLDASFRERAERLGLELPVAAPATALPATSGRDHVEAIWQRAQLQSAAFNGPGDALMRAVGDAADARWEQRQGRGSRDVFDI